MENLNIYYENINSIIKNSFENINSKGEILFFEVSDMEQYSEIMKNILVKYNEDVIIEKQVNENEFIEAYHPFMDILKEDYKKNKSNFYKSDIYYYHKSSFEDYLEDKITEKNEDIIKEEINYIISEMDKAVFKYFKTISKKYKMIININGIEKLKESSLRFIRYLNSSKNIKNILWIFSYTKNINEKNENRNNWENLIEEINRKSTVFTFNFKTKKNKKYIEKEINENIKHDKSVIKEKIEICLRNFNFMALEESKIQFEKLYQIVTRKNIKIDEKYYYLILRCLGDIYFYTEDKDKAIYYYGLIMDFGLEIQNKEIIAEAYMKSGKVFYEKNNREISLKYIQLGIKLAKELNDELLYLRLKYFEFEASHTYINYEYKKLKEMFYEIKELAEKLNHEMILCKIFGIIVTDNKTMISYDEKMEYCLRGIEIADKKKNKYKQASLYHDLGIIYSMAGQNEKAFFNYKKSQKLKIEMGNKHEIARIYNGTGYGYFVAENYEKAMEYYNKGLEYLKELKQYEEIGLSFYNIALLSLFSEKYEYASYLLEKINEMLKILGIKTLPFHTIFGIYSLLGIAYMKTGNTARGYNNLLLANSDIIKNNQEEYFFYLILNSLIKKYERNYKQAEEYLLKIEEIKNEYCIQLFLPKYYYEYGILAIEMGDDKKAIEILKTGLDYCENKNFHYSKKQIIREINKIYGKKQEEVKSSIKVSRFNADNIIDSLKQDMVINKLYKKIDEVNYINTLQRRLLEFNSTVDYMIKKIGEFIDEIFMVEEIFIFSFEENSWKIVYAKNKNFDKKKIYNMLDYFKILKKEIFYDDLEEENEELKEILKGYSFLISIPLFDDKDLLMGEIIVANTKKEMVLGNDDFRLLSISGKQIRTALINNYLNDKLENRNAEIEKKNKELVSTIEELNMTQQKLVESEKMASLGNLVAGVAHEINTPVGVSLTAASFISGKAKEIKEIFYTGQIKKSELEKFLKNVDESNRIIASNLERAAELILSFKQIAVDQTTEEMRIFNVEKYLFEILLSLRPKLKVSKVKIEIFCEEDILINGYPGVFSQIINNLVMNSLIHAFEKIHEGGIIYFGLKTENDRLYVNYKDNGKGMTKEVQKRIFEPFFTTKRNQGGTGLGMSIIYNLIKQRLQGEISVSSELGKGSCFTFDFPIERVKK